MVDLSADMQPLVERLGAPPAEGARVLQVLAARDGEGASTVARELARALAPRSRRGVWLVELDLLAGAQFEAIAAAPDLYGELGDPVPAAPDGESFFRVDPPVVGADGRTWPDSGYLDAYPVGAERLWVTRLRREALKAGQRVELAGGREYWDALRPHADWVVVDAPAVQRSRAGLVAAPAMDATFLVVSAEHGDPRGPIHVRDALAAAGGHCSGVVLNRSASPMPRFLRRLIP
ncbi:MAG: hypothetical protein INR64_06570 [Caulobacteraceae bacterium]|nr:hypothetical protein [Caulobacter sp.]